MTECALMAISPIDGRYAEKTHRLKHYLSEFGLHKFRVLVEIRWLQALSNHPQIDCPAFSIADNTFLDTLIENFSIEDAKAIKAIEARTNHDVKAIEYFIKEKLKTQPGLQAACEYVHFACTSEDINNLAYAKMIQTTLTDCFHIELNEVLTTLFELAQRHGDLPMLSRTHGQPASPTTLGKEFANVHYRLNRQVQSLKRIEILGKINGAVGNFNAHCIAYPDIDWLELSKTFVQSLGLTWNPLTTQIEPHDYIAECFHQMVRIQVILMDFCRDIWGYIALDYFKQKLKAGEVGSSTMPHKVNPIDFENAEGNFGISNATFGYLAQRLPLSRWQRDLTDSTLLRNVGVAFAHSWVALTSLKKGLSKLEINPTKIAQDLDDNPQVLTEAIQTVMRRYKISEPYEKLKAFSRGKSITSEGVQTFIESLELPQSVKQRLLALTPKEYIGLAEKLIQLQ